MIRSFNLFCDYINMFIYKNVYFLNETEYFHEYINIVFKVHFYTKHVWNALASYFQVNLYTISIFSAIFTIYVYIFIGSLIRILNITKTKQIIKSSFTTQSTSIDSQKIIESDLFIENWIIFKRFPKKIHLF